MSKDLKDIEELRKSLKGSVEEEDDFLNELDLPKLLVVARKSLIWVVLIFSVSIIGAFLYYRYTKPIYQSSSILKLDLKSDAGVLGFESVADAYQQSSKHSAISGEIELIKSRLIYEKVIDKMDLEVSYYNYGKILSEEKYKNAPWVVNYFIIKDSRYYDVPFEFTVLNEKEFTLRYKNNEEEKVETYKFGQKINNASFEFIINLTSTYSEAYQNKLMFFVVNSKKALVDFLAKNISVEILNLEASTIQVSFKDNNENKARDIVNIIDTVYLQQTIERKTAANEQTIEFLEATLQRTDSSLANAEKEIEFFITKNKTIDVRGDFGKAALKMEEIDKQRLDLRIKISLLNDLVELVTTQKKVDVFLPSLYQIPDPQLSEAINVLNELQQDRLRLAATYSEETYVLKSKNNAIESAEKSILELVAQNKKLLFEQINELNRQMLELENDVLRLPAKETQFTRLKRYYDLYEKFYLLLMQKQAEYAIAKAGVIPNFVILSPALLPNTPIYPNRNVLYLIGFGVGTFLGIALILIRYFLYDSITTQKELERSINAPVLGGIPEYTKEKLEVSKLIVDKNPKLAISEALRSIRTNLEFICPNKKKKLISVTSTTSGEGKTFAAVNLGGIIAMSNQRVIVLDLDMRKPKVHLAFDQENFKGMSTIIIGKHSLEECIHSSSIENLSYITAGPTPPNPSELMLRSEFHEVLNKLHETYDVIIIDTPPVGLVTDGILIMQKADISLYVVRANYSKKSVKKNINNIVKTTGLNNMAVILNALKTINTYGGYGYGYGYYEGDKDNRKSFWKRIFSSGK